MPAMSRIDLHTHTDRSDGTFTPAQLVRLAAERDIDVIAITDHDTTEALEEGRTAVVAHPGMWDGEAPLPPDLIELMAGAGLAGLEVEHSDHTPEQRERYRALAEQLGLVPTGGSDCHGTRYDPIRLGGALCAPDDFAALRERAR